MARAEITWEDQPGAWRGAQGRIEDTSRSGACIRVPVPISIGQRLKIKWHREEFLGIAKYCRRDGGDYVLGIQREISENEARPTVLLRHATTRLAVASAGDIPGERGQQEHNAPELPAAIPQPGSPPTMAAIAAASLWSQKRSPRLEMPRRGVRRLQRKFRRPDLKLCHRPLQPFPWHLLWSGRLCPPSQIRRSRPLEAHLRLIPTPRFRRTQSQPGGMTPMRQSLHKVKRGQSC